MPSRGVEVALWSTAGLRRRVVGSRLPTEFVILTPGRAGSLLLLDLLSKHPQVRVAGELLGGFPHEPRLRSIARIRLQHRLRAAAAGASAWGWSLHPPHLTIHGVADPGLWIRRFHDHGGRMVVVTRHNLVHHALSAVIASQTQQWHRRDAGRQQGPPVRLSATDVLATLHQAEADATDVENLVGERSHLAIHYEDDLRDHALHQRTADRLFAFLGLPTVPVSASLVRRSRPFREAIANYDEIADALAATPHAAALAEVDPERGGSG